MILKSILPAGLAYLALSGSVSALTGDDLAPAAKTSEIGVRLPNGRKLKDGKNTRNFGTVEGPGSTTRTFSIRNSGTAPLRNISFSVSGKYKAEFTIISPNASKLAPGASMEFKVRFKPRSMGLFDAVLHIHSSDRNENPFDVGLFGAAVPGIILPPS